MNCFPASLGMLKSSPQTIFEKQMKFEFPFLPVVVVLEDAICDAEFNFVIFLLPETG